MHFDASFTTLGVPTSLSIHVVMCFCFGSILGSCSPSVPNLPVTVPNRKGISGVNVSLSKGKPVPTSGWPRLQFDRSTDRRVDVDMAHSDANFEEMLTPMRIRRRSRRGETDSPAPTPAATSPLVADAFEQGRRSALWEMSCRTRLQTLSNEWQVVKDTPTKRKTLQKDGKDEEVVHLPCKRRRMTVQGITETRNTANAMVGKERQTGSKKDSYILRKKNVATSRSMEKYRKTSILTPRDAMAFTPQREACRTPAGKENTCSTRSKEKINQGETTLHASKSLAERRRAAEEKFIARQKAAQQRSCKRKR